MPFGEQVAVIYAVTNDYADEVPVRDIGEWEEGLLSFLRSTYPGALRAIEEQKVLDDEITSQLDEAAEAFNETWAAGRGQGE
jgi:F-type H+-transporting ATPase subunit alpha